MPSLLLEKAERKALAAQAHPLNPVVLLGAAGLTPAVLQEIDRALTAHELIKVKLEYVSRFAAQRALPFLVAYDHDGQAAKAWGDVRLTPTTFLLDKQGRIVKRYVGQPDFAALHAQIEKLLAE